MGEEEGMDEDFNSLKGNNACARAYSRPLALWYLRTGMPINTVHLPWECLPVNACHASITAME